MTLVLNTNSTGSYYTDGKKYYTMYGVKDPAIALRDFACIKLGITKRANFTPDEISRINALAGTGSREKTRFELLKNKQAVPVPYKGENPDLRRGDTLLAVFKCPKCSSDTLPGPKCAVCQQPM